MSMRILLVTVGTRGDVQPFVALAQALRARDKEPVICVNADLAPFVERAGVELRPMALDVGAFYERPEVRALLSRSDVPGLVAYSHRWLHEVEPAITEGLERASRDVDGIVSGFFVDDFAAACAEARRMPFVLSGFAPWMPARGLASIVLSPRPLPFEWLNRASHVLTERLAFHPRRALVNRFRARLGLLPARASMLASIARTGAPFLGAWSPLLVPAPPSYGPLQRVTGAWRLPPSVRDAWQERPSAALEGWLAAGPPPVFLSFGSMPMLAPETVFGWCRRLAERGTRVLIGAGASDLSCLGAGDEHVRVLAEAVDHDWLLPRCRSVIHHGGAGSTHTALAAGRPSWAVSLFADGPFWGERLARLGAGGHTPAARLSFERLAHAVATMDEPAVADKARALADGLSQEDGTTLAAETLVDWIGSPRGRSPHAAAPQDP
jgi:sterol 3beta-glucosyltransferase